MGFIRFCGAFSAGGAPEAGTVARMAARLRHRPTWGIRTWEARGLCLAVVGETFDDCSMAVDDGSGRRVWLLGRVRSAGGAIQRAADLLPRVLTEGGGALAGLNGAYAAFILEPRRSPAGGPENGVRPQRKDIKGPDPILPPPGPGHVFRWETDGLGLVPVYYVVGDAARTVYFASELKGLLAVPSLRREVDPAGVADMLRVGYLLGEATLLSGVRCSAPHASYVYDGRGVRQTDHQPLSYEPVEADEGAAIDRYYEALRGAVDAALNPGRLLRRLAGRPEKGVSPQREDIQGSDPILPPSETGRRVFLALSAGRDSRALAGLLREAHHRQPLEVLCCTYGRRRCYDVRYGAAVARQAGFPHLTVPLPPDFMARYLKVGTWLTDGEATAYLFQGLALNAPFARFGGVCLSGYIGDVLGGDNSYALGLAPEARMSPAEYAARFLGRPQRGFGEAALRAAARAPLAAALDHPRAVLAEAYRNAPGALHARKTVYLNLMQQHRRHLGCQVRLLAVSGPVEIPFTDLGVVAEALRRPVRLDARLIGYRRLIAARFPDLARVPSSNMGVPITASTSPAVWGFYRALALSRKWYFGLHPPTLMGCYNAWLRRESRGVLDAVLGGLDYLAPWVDVAWVRRQVAAAEAGPGRLSTHYRRVCLLANLVAWQRLFVDESWRVTPDEIDAALHADA